MSQCKVVEILLLHCGTILLQQKQRVKCKVISTFFLNVNCSRFLHQSLKSVISSKETKYVRCKFVVHPFKAFLSFPSGSSWWTDVQTLPACLHILTLEWLTNQPHPSHGSSYRHQVIPHDQWATVMLPCDQMLPHLLSVIPGFKVNTSIPQS